MREAEPSFLVSWRRTFTPPISMSRSCRTSNIKYPVEYVTLLSAANAKLALECGYTAARSGGCLFNVDVWLKKAIEEGIAPGPRLAASGAKSAASAA